MDNRNEDSGLQEKVLFINRCTKVVKGGRRFSFSALVVVGDGKGRVGMGFGKAKEITDAIKKGIEDGKKSLQYFYLSKGSIAHDVEGVQDGVKVILKFAKPGTGIVAGSYIKVVLDLLGVKNIVAKNLGGNNPNNQVRATINALCNLRDREEIMEIRNS